MNSVERTALHFNIFADKTHKRLVYFIFDVNWFFEFYFDGSLMEDRVVDR